jgi:hypothetical protein
MSKLPQMRRLLVEDFLDQKEWIGNLFTPLNVFMDGVVASLTNGISVRDNCAGDIVTLVTTRVPTVADPIIVGWNQKFGSPTAVYIGNVARVDGKTFALTATPGIQWNYVSKSGIIVTNLFGVVPSLVDKFNITYVIFAG